jgi:hypothetical protein
MQLLGMGGSNDAPSLGEMESGMGQQQGGAGGLLDLLGLVNPEYGQGMMDPIGAPAVLSPSPMPQQVQAAPGMAPPLPMPKPAVPGLSAGQAPGQSGGIPLPMPKPQVPGQSGGGFDLAKLVQAMQGLEPPQDETVVPSPPSAPPPPRGIDPGRLFQALMQLGVHPQQFPQLTNVLR